jgi:hypothetical protein
MLMALLACDALPASPAAGDAEGASGPEPELEPASSEVATPETTASDTPPAENTAPAAIFELGVNQTGQNQPKYFSPLPEGAELVVEYGPQGLWMVVLAFRTKGILDAPLTLDGSVWLGQTLLGQLKLAGQPIFPGPDGYGYYYNFYLWVHHELYPGPGRTATVIFKALDKDQDQVEVVRRVVLVGGPGSGL